MLYLHLSLRYMDVYTCIHRPVDMYLHVDISLSVEWTCVGLPLSCPVGCFTRQTIGINEAQVRSHLQESEEILLVKKLRKFFRIIDSGDT